MDVPNSSIELNLREYGWAHDEPFRVKVDALAVSRLIEAAHRGVRVYELLLINRPGDVWDYLWVTPAGIPRRVSESVVALGSSSRPIQEEESPTHCMPFREWDGLFRDFGEDTSEEDAAWLNARSSAALKAFLSEWHSAVRNVCRSIRSNSALNQHICDAAEAGTHPQRFLARDEILNWRWRASLPAPQHSQAFYRKLEELLKHGDVAAVAYRADGDWEVLRLMANEQRRRAQLTGHSVGNSLRLSALVNCTLRNDAWDSQIWYFSEGLGYGDLFVEGPGLGGAPIAELVERYGRVPGRFILSHEDEGVVSGFDRELGDGYALYVRQNPLSRREALVKSAGRTFSRGTQPVRLRFDALPSAIAEDEQGPYVSIGDIRVTPQVVFDYERTLILIGPTVPCELRVQLAEAIARWQSAGGAVDVVVAGNRSAFEATGCSHAFVAGSIDPTDFSLGRHRNRTSGFPLDVLVVLEPPPEAIPWVYEEAISGRGPWPTWVVSTTPIPALRGVHVVDRSTYSSMVVTRGRRLASSE